MARKESITIEKILDTAFVMTKEEGFENVTARKVATRAGCSTQPIFRVYSNMEELRFAVFNRAVDFFRDFLLEQKHVSGVPFTNLGMAFIKFAVIEKNLFRLLFIDRGIVHKEMYEIINGENGNVVKEISKAKSLGCSNSGKIFMKMWIFVHGVACMSLSGDYDLTEQETIKLLEEAYDAFSK